MDCLEGSLATLDDVGVETDSEEQSSRAGAAAGELSAVETLRHFSDDVWGDVQV